MKDTYINAREVVSKLNDAGYEAYFVGGFVRNRIMGVHDVSDYDICTSATPEEVKKVFPKTFDTGLKHGTVTVLFGGSDLEVTTYRIDGEYVDNRRPKNVEFTTDLREDLRRRDFTFNAMAMGLDDDVFDPFGGKDDLQKKVIRAVGNPDDRFKEDPLRIMRGIRFLAQLDGGFSVEKETLEAMGKHAHLLEKISAERIQIEFIKTVIGQNLDALRVAYEFGIMKHFLPEFDHMMRCTQENPHHCYNVGEHTIRTMENIDNDKVLRLTMLLHDVGKPDMKIINEKGVAQFIGHQEKSYSLSRKIMRRLKFDNDTIHHVSHLVRFHDYELPVTKKAVRKAVNKIGNEYFPSYLKVRKADIAAQSDYKKQQKLDALKTAETLYKEMLEAGVATSLKDLKLDGRDLISLGFEPDRYLGFVLNELLAAVLEKPELNDKELLIEIAKKYLVLQPAIK